MGNDAETYACRAAGHDVYLSRISWMFLNVVYEIATFPERSGMSLSGLKVFGVNNEVISIFEI
jgi:hypothetical protein